MPIPFAPLVKAGLMFLAGWITDHEDAFVNAIVPPVSISLDHFIAWIKSAEPHGGLAALLDSAINHFIDSADASFTANAPKEASSLIDYVVKAITAYANQL